MTQERQPDNSGEEEKPLTLREYLGAFLPPRNDNDYSLGMGKEPADKGSHKQRSLTFREFMGLGSPFYSNKELAERAKDPRPLSLGEYSSVNPLPTLDDMIDFGKWVGRGVQRVGRYLRGN